MLDWDPRYKICLKSELPQTRTVTFKRKKKMIDWKKPHFQKDDNSERKTNGYRVPCSGDSGSGQVVSTSISLNSVEDFKYVLAAVHTGGTASPFTDKNDRKKYSVPCGSYAYDKLGTVLKAESKAQITSWPHIFNWIKATAGIEQPSP